jgi:hypothetical protein
VKYTKSTLQKIENIFNELEYTVRYEKGNFNSGYCIVEDRKIAIINRFFNTEGRINCLIDILSSIVVIDQNLTEVSRHVYRQILKSIQQNSEIETLV